MTVPKQWDVVAATRQLGDDAVATSWSWSSSSSSVVVVVLAIIRVGSGWTDLKEATRVV